MIQKKHLIEIKTMNAKVASQIRTMTIPDSLTLLGELEYWLEKGVPNRILPLGWVPARHVRKSTVPSPEMDMFVLIQDEDGFKFATFMENDPILPRLRAKLDQLFV